jgi:hypothetical protein
MIVLLLALEEHADGRGASVAAPCFDPFAHGKASEHEGGDRIGPDLLGRAYSLEVSGAMRRRPDGDRGRRSHRA